MFNRDYILEGNPEKENMGEYRKILTPYVAGVKLLDVKLEWFDDYKKKLLILQRLSESELIEPPKKKTPPKNEDIKINIVIINLPFRGALDKEKVKNKAESNMDKVLKDCKRGCIN